jgi:hypothetical protein
MSILYICHPQCVPLPVLTSQACLSDVKCVYFYTAVNSLCVQPRFSSSTFHPAAQPFT